MKETNLEKLLRKSFKTPSERNNFYIELLKTKLILLTPENNISTEEGIRESEEKETINFITYEKDIVPIFSSTSKIYEGDVVKNQTSIIAIQGKDLFKLLKGRNFILNPFSEYSKELYQDEVEIFLDVFSSY